MTENIEEFNKFCDDFCDESVSFFINDSNKFRGCPIRNPHYTLLNTYYRIFYGGRAFTKLYKKIQLVVQQPFEDTKTGIHKVYELFSRHLNAWIADEDLILQSYSSVAHLRPFNEDVCVLLRLCAQLGWINLALSCSDNRVQSWAKSGAKLFHEVFQDKRNAQFPKIGQLNACDLMKGMLKLEGFRELVREHFKDYDNVLEVAQTIFSDRMRSILDKTSTDFVMPIRLREPWKFFLQFTCHTGTLLEVNLC